MRRLLFIKILKSGNFFSTGTANKINLILVFLCFILLLLNKTFHLQHTEPCQTSKMERFIKIVND